MKDVLDEIVAHKRVEVEGFKQQLSPSHIYKLVEEVIDIAQPSMREALMNSNEIPLSYQQNGASAISILTDEKYFGGNDLFIKEARESGVTIPILYKNFVIDEYQLFQARLCGASAVLLIAADLSLVECKSLMHIAHELGLEVLLEMHEERELDYAELEPDMYGINNRNLGTFITDVQNSFRLASRLPEQVCKVSESGISNPDTVKMLRMAGFRGFLIGENFMKEHNPGQSLNDFIIKLNI